MAKKRTKKQVADIVTTERKLTKCKRCGSTKRSGYRNTIKRELGNVTMYWRYCNCEDCGQLRVDIERVTE